MAQNDSEPAASRGAWAALAAPGLALLTGFMFLTGLSYNTALLRSFGLSPSGFEEPLPVTVAKGYLSLVGVVVIGFIVVVFLTFMAWLSVRDKSGKEAATSSSARPTPIFDAGTRSLAYWALICLFLLLGSLIGGVVGGTEGFRHRTVVNLGCDESCFYVLVGETEHHGIIIIQDPNRAAIYTSGGLILAKADDIRRISRSSIHVHRRPAPPEPRPK